jgi:hypothetical protein
MTFASLIEKNHPVVSLDEPAAQVARRLVEGGMAFAPVIDADQRYVGMVSLAGLMTGRKGWPSAKSALDPAELDVVPVFAPNEQLFEKLRALAEIKSDIVPIVDDQGSLCRSGFPKGNPWFSCCPFSFRGRQLDSRNRGASDRSKTIRTHRYDRKERRIDHQFHRMAFRS